MCSKNKWTTGNINVAGNSNLVAGNIKKGVNIFGITGSYESLTGMFNRGIPLSNLITPRAFSWDSGPSGSRTKHYFGFSSKVYAIDGNGSLGYSVTEDNYGDPTIKVSTKGWVYSDVVFTMSTVDLTNYKTLYIWSDTPAFGRDRFVGISIRTRFDGYPDKMWDVLTRPYGLSTLDFTQLRKTDQLYVSDKITITKFDITSAKIGIVGTSSGYNTSTGSTEYNDQSQRTGLYVLKFRIE